MKVMILAGIVLIVLGLLGLLLGGIEYTTERQTLQIGPMEATVKEEKEIPIPPLLAGLVLAAGAVLVTLGVKKKPR